jgi:hypothetical protein
MERTRIWSRILMGCRTRISYADESQRQFNQTTEKNIWAVSGWTTVVSSRDRQRKRENVNTACACVHVCVCSGRKEPIKECTCESS